MQRATCLGALDSVNIVVVHLGLGQYTSTIRRYSFAVCAYCASEIEERGKKFFKLIKVGTSVE